MRPKVEFVAHDSGTVTLIVAGRESQMSAEEWESFRYAMPTKVCIEEKRPMFALFGTRTEIRWIK